MNTIARVCVMGFVVSQKFAKSQLFVSARTGGGVVYRKWIAVDKGEGGSKKPKLVRTFFIDSPSAFISILIDK